MTDSQNTQTMDLERDPDRATELCLEAQQRLLLRVEHLTDADTAAPSRLPGWTREHVITHLARNADGHARRLRGALNGEDTVRYPGGDRQRNRDIDDGGPRPAVELIEDLRTSQAALEDVLVACRDAGWPGAELLATVPEHLSTDADRRAFLGWLTGRTELDPSITLNSWG